jgi:hypothetical protein
MTDKNHVNEKLEEELKQQTPPLAYVVVARVDGPGRNNRIVYRPPRHEPTFGKLHHITQGPGHDRQRE